MPERVEANATCPEPPNAVATGIGVLSGVDVNARAGSGVSVRERVAVAVDTTVMGVIVGAFAKVLVAIGTEAGVLRRKTNGSLISLKGLNRLIIWAGTTSGRKRTIATIAIANNNNTPNKSTRVRRPRSEEHT